MEQLLEVVQTLRQRIDEHKSELSKNEAQTRYSLIDPLLRALGWDTADPKQVIPEYPVPVNDSKYRADYKLLIGEEPKVIIEAKKLNKLKGESLFDNEPGHRKSLGVITQGLTYCQEEGVPYLVVTDGRQWDLYETHKPVPKGEKLVLWFDVRLGQPEEVCERVQELAEITGQGAIEDDGWTPLASIDREDLPSTIRFPNGETQEVYNWKDLLVEPVKWLAQNDKLLHDHLPVVMTPNGRPSLVAKEPKHRNNKLWGEKYTEYLEDANVYVYTKCGKDRTFKYAKRIIKIMRFNPEKLSENSGLHPLCEEKSLGSSTSRPMKITRRTDCLDYP